MKGKRDIFAIIAVFAVSFGVYSNSLWNSFVYDDKLVIEENYFIRDLGNLPTLVDKDYFRWSGELTYRPTVTLSYFLDYSLWKLNPFGYHLTNVLIHGLNAIMVYLAVRVSGLSAGRGMALFASIIFATHPALSEPVNAIGYREDLLAALFFLIAFILFLKSSPICDGVRSPSTGSLGCVFGAQGVNVWPYLASLLSYLVSLLSKEMAITLPLILILFDLSIRGAAVQTVGGTSFLRQAWRGLFYRRYVYLGFFLVSGLYLLIRFVILHNPSEGSGYSGGRALPTAMVMPVVIASYIKLLFAPIALNAEYIVSYPSSLVDGPFLLSSAILIVALIVAVRSWRCQRYVSFFILWFFVSLIPVLNIIPILNTMAERYLYIPSIGFVLFIAFILERGLATRRLRFASNVARRSGVMLFILLILFYSFFTIRRNHDWRDGLTLWSKTVAQSPQSFRAHHNLGIAYAEDGLFGEALDEFKKTLAINKDYANVYNDIGNVYAINGLLDEAIKEIKTAIALDNRFATAHYNLANLYNRKGMVDMAIAEYEMALEINQNFPEAYNNIGNAYMVKGRIDDAIQRFYEALRLKGDYFDAHNNLGVAYNRKGMFDEALSEYRLALEIMPDSADIYHNMAIIYEKKGMLEEAIRGYRKALNIDPTHLYSHYNLAMIYVENGSLREAVSELQEVLRIDPHHEDAEVIKEMIAGLTEKIEGGRR